jgi:dihydroorotate dehydrogenase
MTFIRSSLRKPARSLFTVSPIKRTPLRTAVYTTAFVLSAGLFAVYYSDARSALHRYIVTPILRNAFDPETGHKIAIKVLKSGLAPRDFTQDDKVLNCQVPLPLNTSSQKALSNVLFLDMGSEYSQSNWSRCWF